MTTPNDTLLVRAAELYYEDNKTQDEIGAMLRLTRWKVGRMLAQARDEGIVRIQIVHPRARKTALEQALRERFGLRDAVVVPETHDSAVTDRVAQAAADHLQALRPVPRVLGVSWGRTIDAVARHLAMEWATGVDVVQVNGGVSPVRGGNAAAAAVEIAAKGGGAATLLPIPAILERRETRLAIEGDRAVASVLALAGRASGYLYSAGVAGADSILVESGYLTAEDVAELVRRGAVGDVVGRYIDAEGRIVDADLDERTVGVGLDDLRASGTGIAVIAGTAKHAVARAVASSGLCVTLITDEATAETILEKQ